MPSQKEIHKVFTNKSIDKVKNHVRRFPDEWAEYIRKNGIPTGEYQENVTALRELEEGKYLAVTMIPSLNLVLVSTTNAESEDYEDQASQVHKLLPD